MTRNGVGRTSGFKRSDLQSSYTVRHALPNANGLPPWGRPFCFPGTPGRLIACTQHDVWPGDLGGPVDEAEDPRMQRTKDTLVCAAEALLGESGYELMSWY